MMYSVVAVENQPLHHGSVRIIQVYSIYLKARPSNNKTKALIIELVITVRFRDK